MERWTVQHLQDLPTPSEFKSSFELRNMPVVFGGAMKAWKASTSWDPEQGGLEYLKDRAGRSAVQVMVSDSGSDFYGDIRSHRTMEVTFSEFLDIAHASLEGIDATLPSRVLQSLRPSGDHPQDEEETPFVDNISRLRFYLAQTAIYQSARTADAPLHCLMDDTSLPEFLETDAVSNINFWMSVNGSRSSTHYDPFHNVLCVVIGCKEVTLWPPSAAAFLYPQPIYGEASNHSSVDFAKPDLQAHSRFKEAAQHYQTVTLRAGDALFIPEGWYHQVNSAGLTMAVNIWWPSMISLAFGTHMDAYYLRRAVACLVDGEKGCMLARYSTSGNFRKLGESSLTRHADRSQDFSDDQVQESDDGAHKVTPVAKQEFSSMTAERHTRGTSVLKNLSPTEAQYLRILVDSVSSRFVERQPAVPSITTGISDLSEGQKLNLHHEVRNSEANGQDTDYIAQVFSCLEPEHLQRLLLILVNEFPRTLEALILYGLSPVAAELLTRKFEQLDGLNLEISQSEFYKSFYAVFDDPNAAMAALLDGKETFAYQALRNVMEKVLGLKCERYTKETNQATI